MEPTKETVREALEAATPGPWRANVTWPCDIYAGGYFVGATGGNRPNLDHIESQNAANARLIAMAPTLAADWLRLTDALAAETAAREAAEAERDEARRRRDEWRKKAEGYDAVRLALREKVGSPWPPQMSRILWAGIAADEKKRADDAEARAERAVAGLREIADMTERRESKYPPDWREQIENCPECQRYKGHPIQQGICNDHRKPIYAQQYHDESETRVLGYRMQSVAKDTLAALPATPAPAPSRERAPR